MKSHWGWILMICSPCDWDRAHWRHWSGEMQLPKATLVGCFHICLKNIKSSVILSGTDIFIHFFKTINSHIPPSLVPEVVPYLLETGLRGRFSPLQAPPGNPPSPGETPAGWQWTIRRWWRWCGSWDYRTIWHVLSSATLSGCQIVLVPVMMTMVTCVRRVEKMSQ